MLQCQAALNTEPLTPQGRALSCDPPTELAESLEGEGRGTRKEKCSVALSQSRRTPGPFAFLPAVPVVVSPLCPAGEAGDQKGEGACPVWTPELPVAE